MSDKEDMKFLDEVAEERKERGILWQLGIGVVILGLGILSTLWWGKGTVAKVTSVTAQPTMNTLNADVVGFAERFTIMAFNISYADINRQADKVGSLMSDDLMAYYQEAFLDPKWVAFLRETKGYVVYQGVERSSIENNDGTHYWVQVIGKCLYNSDSRGGQIELPFRLVVVVKNEGGRLCVTDFKRL